MKSTTRTGFGTSPGFSRDLDFKKIITALAAWKFPEKIDGVVAIANDGVVPGVLVAQRLGVGFKTITIHYRNEANETQFAQPQLVSSVPGVGGWKRILLVDDLWVTGKSWNTARTMLPRNAEVFPFVFMGDVDCALFRSAARHVEWPWGMY